MIFINDRNYVLEILRLFVLIIHRLHFKWNVARNQNIHLEILHILKFITLAVLSYIELLQLIKKYISLAWKRRLFKPHLVLHLLHGYRYVIQKF